MLWVHRGSLAALEGRGELLRVGEHADHTEARRTVRVVQDLDGKNVMAKIPEGFRKFRHLKFEGLRRGLGAPHLGEGEEEELVVAEGEA